METLRYSPNYIAGHTYRVTFYSPNSEDGAKAEIWGFYRGPGGDKNATYGRSVFEDGYAEIEYKVPEDYQFGQIFSWEPKAFQSPQSESYVILWDKSGYYNQFLTYMLNNETIEFDAYQFEDFKVSNNSGSFKMIATNGDTPTDDTRGTIKVYIPWSGTIGEYNNSVYNNTNLYCKKGLYRSIAEARGYEIEVLNSNPSSPNFQEIKISKPEIGYELILFGFKNSSPTEPCGYMWWTTFHNDSVASMTMQYDSSTGGFAGDFDTPLPYGEQYFFQCEAVKDVDDNLYYKYYSFGSMDLILNGTVFTPIQNTTTGIYYNTIQAAIDAAQEGDEITVAAGEYDQTMNFVGKSGITITGAGENNTIIKPTTVLGWNYFGYTSNRRAAIRIVESENIKIQGITLDCIEIKNNAWYGVFSGNSTGVELKNSTFKNMSDDHIHASDIMIYARALSPFTPAEKATLSVKHCKLIDVGRMGIITHDNVHSVIEDNLIYKPTDSFGFGYGMEIGSASTSEIRRNEIYGFDAPAAGDGSTSSAIYIENCFTYAITEATEKDVTIEDNNIHDCQSGITIGNQFVLPSLTAGNVDMIVNVTGNTLTNNAEYGILVTDEGKSNGSSVKATLTGNNISSSLEVVEDSYGILVYADGNGDLNVTLTGNSVSGYEKALSVTDKKENNAYLGSSFVIHATGNTFEDADYGVYTGWVNWVNNSRQSNPHFSDNDFNNNIIHFENDGDDIDMNFILANNTFDGFYPDGQIIYGTQAGALYVDADHELIKDEVEQTYSVKLISVEDLRGYEMKVKVPKAYFEQPTDFAIGAAYSTYSPVFFMADLVADNDYWIYNVAGSYMGGFAGISGSDKELFSFKAESKLNVDNTPDGCLIEVPYNTIVLKDDKNPYSVIECLASIAFQVIIDSVEPEMTHDNADDYPSPYLLHVLGDGSGLIDRPELDLIYTDNYNLDYARYLIQAENLDAPTMIASFIEAMFDIDNDETPGTWQLPASVNSLADGTYTVYFLVVDDAGNFSIYDWDFIKDTAPPAAITWHATTPCRTTARWDNKIDLNWTNGTGTVKNHIWIKSYATLPDATGYPTYAPASNYDMPAAPNPYNTEAQNGWVRAERIDPPATMPYPLNIAQRGYYYVTIFAEDASGNISAAPGATYYREALNYWLGDVTVGEGEIPGTTMTVNAADIGAMSPHWFTSSSTPGWDNIIDVGPTVGNYRAGRPIPDGTINIEDLMIYSMNYNNTVYTYYREDDDIQIEPIRIEMQYAIYGDELNVDLYLYDNQGYLRGLNIPVQYGSGLSFIGQEAGSLWPEESILLHKDEDGVFTLSGCALGAEGVITENGLISRLTFRINGSDTDVRLCTMIARDIDNAEIEIVNNPTGPSDNDDPVNVIPAVSYMNDNYPNPFNPSTTIRFGLHQGGKVSLKVFNARGQLVRTLINGEMQAGNHQVVWNGVDSFNRPVSSGVYFIRMETKGFVSTKKALMMK